MYDVIVAGAGIAGCTAAREAAVRGKKVLLLEKREQIGGNCRDCYDAYGILIHPYGPHIFHTDREEVMQYLSQFTAWRKFCHRVAARTREGLIPVPFNLHTLQKVFPDKEKVLTEKLTALYGPGSKVSVLELLKHTDKELRAIGEYVYENIYLHYTMKQWGKKPEEIDPSVTGRVPVRIDWEDGYFTNRYQGVPADGFAKLFERMVDHPNITVRTKTALADVAVLQDGAFYFDGSRFLGQVVFTGALDELFDHCYGRLPYRTLAFEFRHYEEDDFQGQAVVNYTVSEAYTRITEYKYLTGQKCSGTTVSLEYPRDYTGKPGEIPYYVIENEKNRRLYERYAKEAAKIEGFHTLGRLAEYRYYDMDAMTERALELGRRL